MKFKFDHTKEDSEEVFKAIGITEKDLEDMKFRTAADGVKFLKLLNESPRMSELVEAVFNIIKDYSPEDASILLANIISLFGGKSKIITSH